MNPISIMKLKLKTNTKPKSEAKRIQTNSKPNSNDSFDLNISIIHENGINANPKVKKIAKNVNFNQVRLQRQGSFYNKSCNNQNVNFFDPIGQIPPSFSNLYLKNYMENKDSSDDGNNNVSIDKKNKIQFNDASSEIKNFKKLEQRNGEKINLTPIKNEVILPLILTINNEQQPLSNIESNSKGNHNFSNKNEFGIYEKAFSIERFNKQLEDELNSKISINKQRKNRSLNINASCPDYTKISSFNYYQSMKMAKDSTNHHKLLPIKLSKERGIEVLSRKIFENINKER